jgi:nucleoside 2-deoxyribosyltransferase
MTREFYEDNIEYPRVDKSQIASYLYYHRSYDDHPKRIPCICTKELTLGKPFYCITMEEIQNWYPRTFQEKVDLFLLNLGSRSNFLGDLVFYHGEKRNSALFVDRNPKGPMGTHPDAISRQRGFIQHYLESKNYASQNQHGFSLSAAGLSRVAELQKSHVYSSKNAFIAMSFAAEQAPIREAIKSAIIDCGFIPRVMDEIEYNNQIVPEMLHEIREARFVVAGLSTGNNGAYYEAGYAAGQGKDVILLIRADVPDKERHFDIRQANIILWKDEEDLKNRLIARIKATIA